MTAGYSIYERCEIHRPLQITGLFTAFEKRFAPDFSFDGESHDFWELVYVAEGMAGVATGQMVYTLSAGQMILHPPMEFHRIWAADGTSPRVMVISFESMGLEWTQDAVRTLSAGQGGQVQRALELLRDNYQMEGMHVRRALPQREVGAARAVCVLEHLLLTLMAESSPAGICDSSRSARQFQRLVAIMEAAIENSLSMAELTQISGMSESSVKRIFARYTGMGPMRYYMDMKVRRAIALLGEGLRVGEVSQRLGFENQNYFCTAFKRVTGCTPTQFRKMQD